MDWSVERNRKPAKIISFRKELDSFIGRTDKGYQVVLSEDLKTGYCTHEWACTGGITPNGRVPCKHLLEFKKVILESDKI